MYDPDPIRKNPRSQATELPPTLRNYCPGTAESARRKRQICKSPSSQNKKRSQLKPDERRGWQLPQSLGRVSVSRDKYSRKNQMVAAERHVCGVFYNAT